MVDADMLVLAKPGFPGVRSSSKSTVVDYSTYVVALTKDVPVLAVSAAGFVYVMRPWARYAARHTT